MAKKAAHLTGQHETGNFETLLRARAGHPPASGGALRFRMASWPGLPRVMASSPGWRRRSTSTRSDDRPVDLVYLLLAPENGGRRPPEGTGPGLPVLRDEALCEKLRGCDTAEGIYALLNTREAATRGVGGAPPRIDAT